MLGRIEHVMGRRTPVRIRWSHHLEPGEELATCRWFADRDGRLVIEQGFSPQEAWCELTGGLPRAEYVLTCEVTTTVGRTCRARWIVWSVKEYMASDRSAVA